MVSPSELHSRKMLPLTLCKSDKTLFFDRTERIFHFMFQRFILMDSYFQGQKAPLDVLHNTQLNYNSLFLYSFQHFLFNLTFIFQRGIKAWYSERSERSEKHISFLLLLFFFFLFLFGLGKFATNLLFCTSVSFTDVWNIQIIWKQNRLHINWNSWILSGKDKNRKSYLHSKSLCIHLDRGFYLNLALYIVCLFVFYSLLFIFFWRYTDNGNTWNSLLSCRPISVVVKNYLSISLQILNCM